MNQAQFPEQPQIQSDQQEQQAGNAGDTKQKTTVFMPLEYNKAKRSVTKIVNNYFTKLREEIKNNKAKLYLDQSKLIDIETAITLYVGLRYNDKKYNLDLKVNQGHESKLKDGKQKLLSYLSQSQKLISYSHAAKANVITLVKDKYKLPDIATPIAFENSVFFLDPCNYDTKRKDFIPTGPAFSVLCGATEGKLRQIAPPIYFRSKCAIVKKAQFVYLLGGQASQRKILTNRCEKYNMKTFQSVQIPPMRHQHVGPTACFLGQQLWVFSVYDLQMFNGEQWIDVGLPFTGSFYPFQFVFPVNEQQILIFGGVNHSQKSKQIKLYNTKYKNINNYGRLLPQGMSNQRSNGAAIVHGCVGALSSIQASVYPQIGIKSHMSEVLYIYESSAYLNSIITL